jgi:uncharacterized membrane protein YgdD (TMEM256/DUF423 family)
MYKPALISGCFFACLAVILGAFGAHALKAVMPQEQLQTFETGVRYQFYHAFALLAAGIIYGAFPTSSIRLATVFFSIGVVLFSGSLYLLAALKMNGKVGLGGLGIITPVGGLCFIVGWLLLWWGVFKKV